MQGRAEMEMKWLLATAGLVILLMFPLLPSGIAAPVGDGRLPGVADAMLKADFWLAKLSSPRQVVLEPAGIVAFNRAIVQALPQVVEDLDGFPLAVDRASLRQWLAAERLPRGVRRERHLKLGKGGLSDVEWTVQLMQLQHAGDIKDLRVNGTLEALDVLEAKKLISAIDAIQLRKAWTLCTAARNGSYLWSGRANQADILPDDIYSLGGIAVYLGYGAHRGQHFENDLLAVMRKCRDVCQRLFYGKTEGEAAAATTATASAATQQPQTAPRPRMHVIAPRLERNRRRAQR